MDELRALIEAYGGTDELSEYLGLPAETIELALSAPNGAWTERVARMVEENTRKLLQMPSQGGFFWRTTRKRVVKDWLILARWSDALGGEPVSAEAVPTPEDEEPTRLGKAGATSAEVARLVAQHLEKATDEDEALIMLVAEELDAWSTASGNLLDALAAARVELSSPDE